MVSENENTIGINVKRHLPEMASANVPKGVQGFKLNYIQVNKEQ